MFGFEEEFCTRYFENENMRFSHSLKHFPWGLIDKKSSLIEVMVWRRTGDKPLPQPKMTQFNDAHTRHQASIVLQEMILLYYTHKTTS